MIKPLISVIVPIYNTEQYVSRCIESILKQSYQNIEIILVNDGSTDNSYEICENYAKSDSRIILLKQQNGGVSSARNAGLKMSNGKFVMFVDSDDELIPSAIKILYDDVTRYNADIACALLCTNSNIETKNLNADNQVKIYEGSDALNESLFFNSQSACARLFDLEFIKDIEFEVGKRVNEDGFFMFECYVRQPKLTLRNTYIYKYNSRENSASKSKFSDKYLDVLYFLNKKIEIINRDFPDLKEKATYLEIKTHLNFLQILCRTLDNKYRENVFNSLKIIKEKSKGINKDGFNDFEKKQLMIIKCGLFPVYRRFIYYFYNR